MPACVPPAARTADQVTFIVSVREVRYQPAPALHSFAVAVHDGKWLLICGRTNGVHRARNPASTFPSKFANEYIHVLDPACNATWKVGLPEKHQIRFRATNAEFYQDGDALYVVGGYRPKTDADAVGGDHTFPTLTAVRVPEIMAAITAGRHDQAEASVTDERMRVTGWGLQKIGDTFYLVFGQNYDRRYTGAVTGKYTCEVRRFKVKLGAGALAITDCEAIADPVGPGPESQYRRDLNVAPAVRADSRLGVTVYGGVFTQTGGAWQIPVSIDQDAAGKATVTVDATFAQKMCQYDTARVLMFDPGMNTMYTSLLGGITLFYYNHDGKLDESNLNNVMPFTRANTTLARGANGTTVEVPQPPATACPDTSALTRRSFHSPGCRGPRTRRTSWTTANSRPARAC